MSRSNLPALKPLLPPDGTVFFATGDNPLALVSRDLCKIAAFLQEREPYAKLNRFDDWWQHDGLHFEKGSLDLHGLFGIVGTPRSLLEVMTGDDRVFVAVAPVDRSWYLRFLADWDANDESLVGEYSITVNEELLALFEGVVPKLSCPIEREQAPSYFARIEAC